MTNYYLRSIMPDGTGEVVQPDKEKEPNIEDCRFQRHWIDALDEWKEHIASLPQVATASPELVKMVGVGNFIQACKSITQVKHPTESDWKDFISVIYEGDLHFRTYLTPEKEVDKSILDREPGEAEYTMKKSMEPKRPIYIDQLRQLLNLYDNEEMSMSRFAEALNLKAWKFTDEATEPLKAEIQRLKEEDWISVEDGLPECACTVDVFVADEYGKRRCADVEYRLSYFFNKKDRFEQYMHTDEGMRWVNITTNVTHWRKLPEPPKQTP